MVKQAGGVVGCSDAAPLLVRAAAGADPLPPSTPTPQKKAGTCRVYRCSFQCCSRCHQPKHSTQTIHRSYLRPIAMKILGRCLHPSNVGDGAAVCRRGQHGREREGDGRLFERSRSRRLATTSPNGQNAWDAWGAQVTTCPLQSAQPRLTQQSGGFCYLVGVMMPASQPHHPPYVMRNSIFSSNRTPSWLTQQAGGFRDVGGDDGGEREQVALQRVRHACRVGEAGGGGRAGWGPGVGPTERMVLEQRVHLTCASKVQWEMEAGWGEREWQGGTERQAGRGLRLSATRAAAGRGPRGRREGGGNLGKGARARSDAKAPLVAGIRCI